MIGTDGWTLDVLALLVHLTELGECWCEEMDATPCAPCRAQVLIDEAPIAAPDVHQRSGRRTELVKVAGGRL